MFSVDHLVTALVIGILAAVFAILLVMVPIGLMYMRGLGGKIDGIHLQLNSKMDSLLHAHGAAERAAGIEQERTEEQARQVAREERTR